MKHSLYPWEHDGICHTCGLPTTKGYHEECGTKDIDDIKRRAKTKATDKKNKKDYLAGKLPPWMYS